jgi:hypothetical protein
VAPTDYDLPLWLQALSYPAQNDRLLLDAAFPGTGVLGSGELAVAPRAAGGNMSVDVAPGRVVIAGTDMALQGKYVGRLKNTVNVTLAAAPTGGLVRIDLIHAHITDAGAVGGTTNAMTVEQAITGTAVSSNPTPPAVPATSEPLAQVLVAAGTAAINAGMITDRRRQLGATYRAFATVTDRDATWTAPPNGALAMTVDTGRLWRRIGGAWLDATPLIQSANVAGTTDAFGNFLVNLPAGAKAISAAAVGSQVGFPHVINLNVQDFPLGSSIVCFSVRNMDGSFVANATITIAYVVTYSF